jgi:hypothetical protein
VSDTLFGLKSSSDNECMVSGSVGEFDNLRCFLVQVVAIFSVIVDFHLGGLEVTDVGASSFSVLADEVG